MRDLLTPKQARLARKLGDLLVTFIVGIALSHGLQTGMQEGSTIAEILCGMGLLCCFLQVWTIIWR